MTVRALVNGRPATAVSLEDRGLRYGDGLFETIAFRERQAALWSLHMRRLQAGCRCLEIEPPDPDQLLDWARRLTEPDGRAVVRVTVTRGDGGRGYFPPDPGPVGSRVVVQSLDWPEGIDSERREGLEAIWCSLRLSRQPALAGIKHLARLEQVMAAAECARAGVPEGFVLDTEGLVVEAIHSNVLIFVDDTLLTPELDVAGVRGVGLDALVGQDGVSVTRARITPEQVARATEWMVVNSVRGIRPVTRLGESRRSPGPVCRFLQDVWNQVTAPDAT